MGFLVGQEQKVEIRSFGRTVSVATAIASVQTTAYGSRYAAHVTWNMLQHTLVMMHSKRFVYVFRWIPYGTVYVQC